MKVTTSILLFTAQLGAASSDNSYNNKEFMNTAFFETFVGTAAYDPRAGKQDGGSLPYGKVGPVEQQNGPRCFESATDSAVAMQAYYAGVTSEPMLFSKSIAFNCGPKFLNPGTGVGNGDRCAVESYIRWGTWARNPDQVKHNLPELLGFCGKGYRKQAATKMVLEQCGKFNETVQTDEDLCQIRNYDIPRNLAGKCKAKIGNWNRLTSRLNGIPSKLESGTCRVCATPNGANWTTSSAFGGTEAQCRKSVQRLAAVNITTQDYCSCKKMTNNYTSWKIPQTIKKGDLLGGCLVDLRKLYADRIKWMQEKHGFPTPARGFPSSGSISNMLIARAITELGGVYSLADGRKLSPRNTNMGDRCSSGHNHLVVVVGFNFTAKEPYWIIKNSRGPKYGDKGYYYLPLGKACSQGGESGWLSAVNKAYFPFWQFKNDKRLADRLKGALMCDKFGTRAKNKYIGGNSYKINYCADRHKNVKQYKLPALFKYVPFSPTPSPTSVPTPSPTTKSPSTSPTKFPTPSPTTPNPTSAPSTRPTKSPTGPTKSPSTSPTKSPSVSPTKSPSTSPTKSPSTSPTKSPSTSPTKSPSTSPTKSPSTSPTKSPSTSPTKSPSTSPTKSPSASPTKSPSTSPTKSPSTSPTKSPSTSPTKSPSTPPTLSY
eukprot:CAMPEP_0203749360 /NCGR_PEP_ID=MMETSP0098-20131031/3955_1 /ASSEMBLY_ACC=CAM_ASM_000208 /TAXON_ID=96639 /ORGANISM=" , Strain NY0313808BC1" /LENGTH=654 /DNA_ID=CAMNT_0050638405 /DNA_START=433 /DNA_END=2397 /DNA_ORIENTATION=-